jgi:hypothetical protein
VELLSQTYVSHPTEPGPTSVLFCVNKINPNKTRHVGDLQLDKGCRYQYVPCNAEVEPIEKFSRYDIYISLNVSTFEQYISL